MKENSAKIRIQSLIIPIILINIIIFVVQKIVPEFTIQFLLNSGTVLEKPWTLLTSMFMHGSVMHLIFNMYALFLFGPLVEQRIGWKRFIVIYLISGIIAGLGFMVFQELILGVTASALGASGAIMAVLGLTIMFFPHLQVLFFFIIPMSLRTAGIIFVLIDVFGLFHDTGIASSAHLAGLAVGLIYGWYLLKKKKLFYDKFEMRGRSQKHSKVISVRNKADDPMMTDEEIDEYLKHGRI